MIPKRVYLRAKELNEHITCERMVSCDEPFDCCNVEYTALSQLWHDANEEPRYDELLLGVDSDGVNIYKWRNQENNWESFANYFVLKRWAYIHDFLPKD